MSEDVFSARRAKLENLRESGDPYPNDFKPDHKVGALCNEHGEKSREQLADEKPPAKIAGRIMLRRSMGKAVFFDFTRCIPSLAGLCKPRRRWR